MTQWSGFSQPVLAVQATFTQAAAGAGLRNVLRAFSCSTIGAASSAFNIFRVIDGATGGPTILWDEILRPDTVNFGGVYIQHDSLFLIGSPNTAMTVEFVAGVAGHNQLVSASGFVI